MTATTENDPRRAGTIWVLNLDEPLQPAETVLPVTFRRITQDFAPALARAMDYAPPEEILNRLRSGRRCYAAWVGDQIASYGWVSFEDEHIGELNLQMKLLRGEAYIWDCATLPAFRRQHLYSALLVYIRRELHADGYCRAWIGADMENKPSQQGIARAGFHHVGNLVVERVLAIRQVWVQEQPGVPEHIIAEARRAFLNDRDQAWKGAASAAGVMLSVSSQNRSRR